MLESLDDGDENDEATSVVFLIMENHKTIYTLLEAC